VSPDPAAVQLLPEEKAKFQRALPIAFEGGVPVVAVADPSNSLVIENLRRLLNAEPRLVVAAYSELVRKIDHAYATLAPAPQPVAEAQLDAAAAVETPVPAPTPAPTPEPAPIVPPVPAAEPVAEQPAVPTVAPMPAVLPPVETHVSESVEPAVPFVAEQPGTPPAETAPTLQPLAEQTLAQEPVMSEPVVTAPVVAETPAPVIEPLAAPAEQVTPAPVVDSPATETPAHVPEFSQVPVEEPAPTVAEPVAATEPVATPEPVAEPEPAVAQPVATEPVVEVQASEEPTTAPAPTTDGFQAEASTHFVVLRLSDGEHLEVGKFGSADEAQGFAQEVVRQIAATEGESAWPFFAGRFLRPETIVSVDVIAESQERWLGSQIRSRWATTDAAQ